MYGAYAMLLCGYAAAAALFLLEAAVAATEQAAATVHAARETGTEDVKKV